MKKSATAFAPATVANVAVGFDILGHAIEGAGDEVTVTRLPGKARVVVGEVTGIAGTLPTDPRRNTATAGLLAFIKDHKPDFGFEVSIRKGIAMGSGMGGSAASAVGGLVAANALLHSPLPKEALFHYALIGEKAASASIHGDNVAPCLFGGLCLIRSVDPPDLVAIPVSPKILCVLVHPHLEINTRRARAILKPDVKLASHVRQSSNLAGFLTGCIGRDIELIRRSLEDVVIEPQRKKLIPGFEQAKRLALKNGALGFSISGSGPSVFAWVDSPLIARRVRDEVLRAFKRAGLGAEAWISPITLNGARVIA
ncbi:MAG: homoserine kinase [Deltaproteobacteria bacterium]|nr:homoserine kinase [Deltaproteobacteria bacterium]